MYNITTRIKSPPYIFFDDCRSVFQKCMHAENTCKRKRNRHGDNFDGRTS